VAVLYSWGSSTLCTSGACGGVGVAFGSFQKLGEAWSVVVVKQAARIKKTVRFIGIKVSLLVGAVKETERNRRFGLDFWRP